MMVTGAKFERQEPVSVQTTVKNKKILWVDDEIDFLRPHILFLEEQGYTVVAVNNGLDAIEHFISNHFDIVFLDENMPGISGIETLYQLKKIKREVPVVMITKTEAEATMKEAIAGKISDYLVKPVTLNQVYFSLKRNL